MSESNPNSQFCQVINDYILSQLEGTFKPEVNHAFGTKKQNTNSKKIYNKAQKGGSIEVKLMIGEQERENSEEKQFSVNTPNTVSVDQNSKNGYMRPTNSPVRFRKRTYSGFRKRSSSGVQSKSSSTNIKI